MYADVDALVADVMAIYDNTETSTLQNPTKRTARIVHYLQRTVEDVWFHRAWPFAMASASVVMVAGAKALPTDFGRISIEGALLDASGIAWVEISYQDMAYLRKRKLKQGSKLFAIGPTIQVVDTASTSTFTLVYQTMAPTMVAGATGDLGFPQPFGEVLLLGTVMKLKEEEGDARQIWRADYASALAKVGTMYVRASRPQQMPVTIGGMW
jgi:hypothetical protein